MSELGEDPFRGLDDEQRRAWVNLVKVLLTLPGTLESQLLKDADLTLLGYMILARLSAVPGSALRMSELAEMTNGSLPRLSHAVARMEDRGWVTRTVCAGTGRRFTLATLTDAGREHLNASTASHVATVRRLVVEPLGENFVSFGDMAARVVEALGLPTTALK